MTMELLAWTCLVIISTADMQLMFDDVEQRRVEYKRERGKSVHK